MLVKNIFQLNKNDAIYIRKITGENSPHIISDINYHTELFSVYNVNQLIKFNPDVIEKIVCHDEDEISCKFDDMNLNKNN